MGIPCKTAAGHAELAARERRLSQRHRTLLLLVDGRRDAAEVLRLGEQAGVPRAYFDELMALGLIVLAAPVQAPLPALADLAWAPTEQTRPGREAPDDADSLPFGWPTDLSSLPRVFSSAEDSVGFGAPVSNTELSELERDDPALAQARSVVLQALLATSPVIGAVTMLRVRRSRSRAQLRALLPEVQARLSRPRHLADARLVIQRVEALLAA
ncbi:MAG: hypothetical protein L6Q75_09070 [Burkholderiaceae bacterium]|nr:hypothetical protein [Burkholderiaceae bacterium]